MQILLEKKYSEVPLHLTIVCLLTTIFLVLTGCNEDSDNVPQDMILTNQAYQEMINGNYLRAEAMLDVALSINSENPYALLNLGVVYQDTGRYDQAIGMYEKVIALDPEEKAVLSNDSSFHGKRLVEIAKENLKVVINLTAQ